MRTTAGAQPVLTSRARMPGLFFVWLGGSLLSQAGDAVLYFAVGWTAAAYGGSWAGVALSAIVLPRTVLMLLGGVVSDRRSPRSVMVGATVAVLLSCVLFAGLALVLGVPPWLLIALGLVIGTADAFYLPAAGSMPRLIVGKDLLPRALAMRQSSSQLVLLVGAPLGGILVATIGMPGVALVDAATFAVMLAVLVRMRQATGPAPAPPTAATPSPAPGPGPGPVRRSILTDALDGVRVAARHPVLRPGLLLTAVVAAAAIPVPTLVVPLLARDQGLAAGAAGLVVGAESAGAIVVALAVSRFGTFSRPGLVAPIALGVISAGVAALAVVSGVVWLAAAGVVGGVGLGLFVSHLGPLLLGASPDGHLARVQALLGLVQSAALLVTNNVLGAVAQLATPQAAAWVCASLLAAAAVGVSVSPTFRSSTL